MSFMTKSENIATTTQKIMATSTSGSNSAGPVTASSPAAARLSAMPVISNRSVTATTGASQTPGSYYTLTGSEEFEQEYLERLAKVRPADIKRVARRYFTPSRCVSVEVRPAEKK